MYTWFVFPFERKTLKGMTIFTLTKIVTTAILIVIISEVGKFNDKLGGLLAALPLVTIFVVCWMYFEGVSENKIANHFKYTILFLIPTLPGFFIVPFLIPKLGFFYSLLVFILLSGVCIFIVNELYKKFGVTIL